MLKNYERKQIHHLIYANFERILTPEDNRQQNPNESFRSLKCVDIFSKRFRLYLGEIAVYNFLSCTVEEGKHCNDLMKKHCNKELAMIKKDNEEFDITCWICDNDYVYGNVKVRDHCHIAEKYRSSAHKHSNIKFELNHKIPVTFHNLKNMLSILFWNN